MSSKTILLKLKRLLEELEQEEPKEITSLNGKFLPVIEKDSIKLQELIEKGK